MARFENITPSEGFDNPSGAGKVIETSSFDGVTFETVLSADTSSALTAQPQEFGAHEFDLGVASDMVVETNPSVVAALDLGDAVRRANDTDSFRRDAGIDTSGIGSITTGAVFREQIETMQADFAAQIAEVQKFTRGEGGAQ